MDIAAIILIPGVLLLVLAIEQKIRQADRRVARLERKLDKVLDHMGLSATPPELRPVVTLLRENQKLVAIKVYRDITGADFKTARLAVKRLANDDR